MWFKEDAKHRGVAENALNDIISSLISSANAIGREESRKEYKERFKIIGLDKVAEENKFFRNSIFR